MSRNEGTRHPRHPLVVIYSRGYSRGYSRAYSQCRDLKIAKRVTLVASITTSATG